MSRDQAKKPRVIYILGIDGSGKTTAAEYISGYLTKNGYRVGIRWLRFNHFFSKPLLGLCRLLGYTKYEQIGKFRIGYHEFHRSSLIAWSFVFLQYLDALRVKFMYLQPFRRSPATIVVLDRYVYDILIDLMIDTRLTDLDKGHIGQAFKKLLPNETFSIMLYRSKAQVLLARPESSVDREFNKRFLLYDRLRDEGEMHVIENNGTQDELLQAVQKQLVGLGL